MNTQKNVTPLMEQYMQIKKNHSDSLLFLEWEIFMNYFLKMLISLVIF